MTEEQFILRLLEALGDLAADEVRPKIPSRTLRDAMRVIVDAGVPEVRLFIPHYWAVYLHDGRGPIHPSRAEFLVFFADPKDDPRIQGGYPERASQIRRLSRSEFEEGLDKNAERRRLGLSPFMFVLTDAGPAGGAPFFTDGMVAFSGVAKSLISEQFDTFVQGIVDEIGPDTDEATFNL